MKQFHEGISSKTFKKPVKTSIRPIDCLVVALIGLVLSISA